MALSSIIFLMGYVKVEGALSLSECMSLSKSMRWTHMRNALGTVLILLERGFFFDVVPRYRYNNTESKRYRR